MPRPAAIGITLPSAATMARLIMVLLTVPSLPDSAPFAEANRAHGCGARVSAERCVNSPTLSVDRTVDSSAFRALNLSARREPFQRSVKHAGRCRGQRMHFDRGPLEWYGCRRWHIAGRTWLYFRLCGRISGVPAVFSGLIRPVLLLQRTERLPSPLQHPQSEAIPQPLGETPSEIRVV